jgi:hypothetical protein
MFAALNPQINLKMKKFKVLLCAVLVAGFSFTSCSDDDEDTTPVNGGNTSASIEGRWYFSQEGTGTESMAESSLRDYDHADDCGKDYVLFNEGGVLKTIEFDGDDNCAQIVRETAWAKNGNTLTFGTGAEATTAEVIALTSTTLKIREVNPDFGGSGLTVYDYTVFTRN